MQVYERDMFGSRDMPQLRRAQLVDFPVPSSYHIKVLQMQSLTRMNKSYDETQRKIKLASFYKLGQRLQRYE